MKIHVTTQEEGMKIDSDFEGATADEVVGAMKSKVAKEITLALRPFVNAMSPLAFAQEVTRRYNAKNKTSEPLPKSCAEFIEKGQQMGTITVVEP
jgi:hypothetical protein